MTVSHRIRSSAEQVASACLSEPLTQTSLRSVAYALGCQDPDAVLAHLNPQVLKGRLAHVLVEALIEAMEDAQANAA